MKRPYPNGSAIVAEMVGNSALNEVRRAELGVEALCELVTDLSHVIAAGESHRPVAADYRLRLAGIQCAVSGEGLPWEVPENAYLMTAGMLLWTSLSRILEMTSLLALRHSISQWMGVHEVITTWRDCWGDDDRAGYALLRFSTLTGLVQGKRKKAAFLNDSLVQVLSVIRA